MGLSNYFDLRQSFPFYGAYHNETRNQIIHCVFVPVIFTTALTFGSFVKLGSTGFTLSDAAAAFYATSFVKMEVTAGLLYAPVIGAMHHIGTRLLPAHLPLAVGLHALGWILQFIGHGVFEGRKPALLDNLLQSLHASVFFVWLEILFAFGYRPKLKRELNQLVAQRIAQLNKKA